MLYFELADLMYNGQNEREKGMESISPDLIFFLKLFVMLLTINTRRKKNGSIIYRNRTHY